MFVDNVKILLKAGDGGNGVATFFRDKGNANGGPDGGDGGKGGDVFLQVDAGENTLRNYYYQKHFSAKPGENGRSNRQKGADGESITLKVPAGTIVKTYINNEIKVIADLIENGAKYKILSGGRGGRGNVHFKSSRRQAPKICETGEKTKQFEIFLELKYIADIGLVGKPNAGKSTLLSVISDAKPKIANYHFTTLSPNLGVVQIFDKSFVVADIPGLIEGASMGAGLGHEFLRHIERTRLLLHVVDISEQEGTTIEEDIRVIREELGKHSPLLLTLPQLLVFNKCDLIDKEKLQTVKKAYKGAFFISALTRNGLEQVLKKAGEKLSKMPKIAEHYQTTDVIDEIDRKSLSVTKLEDGVFCVEGGYVENIKRKVILSDDQSFAYFTKRLKDDGIMAQLNRQGIKQGDTVIFGGTEFEFNE